jgi:hypothetical protein
MEILDFLEGRHLQKRYIDVKQQNIEVLCKFHWQAVTSKYATYIAVEQQNKQVLFKFHWQAATYTQIALLLNSLTWKP